jgi:outer membrane murein-binding lipoprotein Lpp
MRRAAIGAALLVALVVAGCGGGGGSKGLSKEEYGSKLNQICTDLNAKQKEIGTPQSPAELGEKGPQLLAALESALGQARKLKAPGEISDQASKFVSLGDQERDLISKLIDAAKANDLTKLAQLGAQIDPLQKESDAVAKQLGAPACASTGSSG